MLAFLLQIKSGLATGQIYPFAIAMVLIWLLWLIRVVLARHYRPWRTAHTCTTSVIIPVVDEPQELFREVLRRIGRQAPTEVIVVINGPRNEALERICGESGVRWSWVTTASKRLALKAGIEMSSGDIAVLVDSDTLWTEGTLEELVKPFRDPRVGGVTTRQRILRPERSVLTRWADWLENVRAEYSLPAMSVLGSVGCLPGRTIAFRRRILVQCLPRFLHERFLGVFLEVSDDRSLTNYTLKAGYHTVYQSTALVYTDAPTTLGKLVKQQYRWSRGSQYNTLRMLPWMVARAPALAVFYVADIVIPFVLIGSVFAWAVTAWSGSRPSLYSHLPVSGQAWFVLLAVVVISCLATFSSVGLRFGRHFGDRPGEIRYLVMFMVINSLVLIPVRVAGFFRMAHNAGWGTRSGGYAGQTGRNPLALVPYLLGVLMLAVAVRIGV